jgi:hypothetical protein
MENIVLYVAILTTLAGSAAFAQSSTAATKSPAKNYKAEYSQETITTKKPLATVQKLQPHKFPNYKKEAPKEKLDKTVASNPKRERKTTR